MALFGLSKKSDYGLTMLSVLAEHNGELVSAADMVKEKKLPKAFVSQIAKDLVKAGILGSKEGKGGGYYLRKEPGKISVKDILVAMEGKVATASCLVKHKKMCVCHDFCDKRPFMHHLAVEMEAMLMRYSLLDITASRNELVK